MSIYDQLPLQANTPAMMQQPMIGERPIDASVDLDALSAHVRGSWNAAIMHRNTIGVTNRLLSCQRQRDGRYEPDVEQLIKNKGCQEFFNKTASKCDAAIAQISDVLNPSKDRLFSIEPTPVPDLPEDVKGEIVAKVTKVILQYQAQYGVEFTDAMIQQITRRAAEAKLQDIVDEAKSRAEGMQKEIDDKMEEGGFRKAFFEFIDYICTYPSAIIKGPVVRYGKRTKWNGNDLEVVREPALYWQAVNPHTFFPGPNVTNPQVGPLHEIVNFEKNDILSMADVPGWSRTRIEMALEQTHMVSEEQQISGSQDRALMEARSTLINAGLPEGSIQGIEFWGPVKGSDLKEWRIQSSPNADPELDELADLDDVQYYEINAILIGNHVVRAVMNPDALGRRPYFVTSWEKVPGSIWGKALVEKMGYSQRAYNATMRNLINNIADGCGPQALVDVDAFDPSVSFEWHPRKTWQFHGSDMPPGRKPVDFFQPDVQAELLLRVKAELLNDLDDDTGIPRYTQGNGDMGGAGNTASGMSMLLNQMNKVIKKVVLNIDNDVVQPVAEYTFNWLLVYSDKEEIKGDCRIIARGAVAQIVHETTQMRRQELFNIIAGNQFALQVIGVKGFAELLRSIMDEIDIDINKVVPPDDELEKMLLAGNQPMLMAPQAGAQPQPGMNTPGNPMSMGDAMAGAMGGAFNGNANAPDNTVNQGTPPADPMATKGVYIEESDGAVTA